MARITYDQMKNYLGNGGSYFSLKPNEEALIRILYNNNDDVQAFTVHEIRCKNNQTITVDCARLEGQAKDACIWCARDSRAVLRVIIPIYNQSTGQIQYWKRTGDWVDKKMKPYTDEVVKLNAPISSQVYKIKRTGTGLDTEYSLIAVGSPDGTTKESFGQIKDPYELGIIKEANFEIPEENIMVSNNTNAQQVNIPQQGVQQYAQPYNAPAAQPYYQPQQPQTNIPPTQATRRTTDMF